MIYVVLGLGAGDEGKGNVVSSLCLETGKTLVVRFSGGQQAGHSVVLPDGRAHVFSNFGSGTLQGAATYWSKYCTLDPVGVLNESNILISKGADPILYIDSECPVTTPYEIEFNRLLDDKNHHGTCGVGVGQTHQRQADHYSLVARDLLYPSVLRTKLGLLSQYYSESLNALTDSEIEDFLSSCRKLLRSTNIAIVESIPDGYDDVIFEGSQGLLLDEDIGFFPHVTRGKNDMTHVLTLLNEVCEKPNFLLDDPQVLLVTRAYQTRHGNGPMTNMDLVVEKNPHETNSDDGIQGRFRSTALDLDLLKYAVHSDPCLGSKNSFNKTLVVTCLDVPSEYICTENLVLSCFHDHIIFCRHIASRLGIAEYVPVLSPIAKSLNLKCGTY